MSETISRSKPGRGKTLALLLALILALSLTAGCSPAAPARDFHSAKAIPGWKSEAIQTYTAGNLSDLVGQSTNTFTAYGFDRVDAQAFLGPKDLKITVQIFRLPDSAEAYGLWTRLRKDKPVQIGVDGASDGISELSFWQDRYFVLLQASQAASPAQLEGLAKNASAALPKGGARPALVERVPAQNQDKRGPIYFRDERAVDKQLFLGGKNLLGLNDKTGAALAYYTLDGKSASLLLVEYPDADALQNGLIALQNAGLAKLLVSGSKGTVLGAVFGDAAAEQAAALLGEALK